MYRGVWYTGAINEEEGSNMPMEDMLEMLKSCCRRGLQYLRMAQYLHLVPQTFYRVMWGV